MREIKFRYYDELYESMESVAKIRFECGKVQEIWLSNGSSIDFMNGNGRFKLMQFTGLLDKNGKEIYEGDIVRTFISSKCDQPQLRDYEQIGAVTYVQGKYLLHEKLYKEDDPDFYGGICVLEPGEYEFEIIGNIHDNPELLK